ncbi:replicative DNA helicase [Nitrospira sp. BLG_2]|uniref:replicative DNA helicase n=1 Tax=Nitrospira sp. BLG_2 TaxID=3397507 RepID=UPI003B9AE421
MQTLPTMPQSVEAEQSVLGALLLDPARFDVVNDIITTDDFFKKGHQLIFSALTELVKNNKPLDTVTLSNVLRDKKELGEVGGDAYLFQLSKNTPSAANVVAYADIVKEKSIKRKIALTASKILEDILSKNEEAHDALENAEKTIFDLSTVGAHKIKPKTLLEAAKEALADIEMMSERNESITGVASGFKDLDALTAGFQPADLVIIAGRPSMGKTALAMNIAQYAALNTTKRVTVLIFSLEMPSKAISTRMIASLAGIDQHRLRTGQLTSDDWARVVSAMAIIETAKIIIDDTPTLTPLELKSRVRRAIKEHGDIGLIIIDYLQFMHSPRKQENRVLEISEISRSLKAVAKEFNVPVIALSQLSRNVESRLDKRPIMSDLRDSGAIEQDADLIAFVYRDEMYNKDSNDKGTAELIIAKHRNGPTGMVKLDFISVFATFENHRPRNHSFFTENKENCD